MNFILTDSYKNAKEWLARCISPTQYEQFKILLNNGNMTYIRGRTLNNNSSPLIVVVGRVDGRSMDCIMQAYALSDTKPIIIYT